MTLQTEIISTETSDFLKQIIFSVLNGWLSALIRKSVELQKNSNILKTKTKFIEKCNFLPCIDKEKAEKYCKHCKNTTRKNIRKFDCWTFVLLISTLSN